MHETSSLESSLTALALGKRTARVVMTDEARVLRDLRMKRGLSMRALGAKMNKSDSYISPVENGRMDIPTGAGLDRYLHGEITKRPQRRSLSLPDAAAKYYSSELLRRGMMT